MVAPTEATLVTLLFHVPPVVVVERVAVEPAHIVDGPEINAGIAFTDMYVNVRQLAPVV